MGWSFGNATTLALLSDPSVLPKSLYDTIAPYLMSLVLYGQWFNKISTSSPSLTAIASFRPALHISWI
jgi:hypothetical protein